MYFSDFVLFKLQIGSYTYYSYIYSQIFKV